MVLKSVDRSPTQFIFRKKQGKVAESVDRSHTQIFYGKLYNMLLQSVDRNPRYFHWHDLLVFQVEASLKIVSFLPCSTITRRCHILPHIYTVASLDQISQCLHHHPGSRKMLGIASPPQKASCFQALRPALSSNETLH